MRRRRSPPPRRRPMPVDILSFGNFTNIQRYDGILSQVPKNYMWIATVPRPRVGIGTERVRR